MTQVAPVLGLQGKGYVDTEDPPNYAAPTWLEIGNMTDVVQNFSREDADVSVRGGNGWNLRVGTLADGGVTFSMIYDPTDPAFLQIEDAWENNKTIQMAFMDGDISVAGNKGYRGFYQVTTFTRNEQLREAMTYDVEVVATYFNDAGTIRPPESYTVPGP